MAHGRSRGRFAKKIDTVHWTGMSGSALALGAGAVAVTLGVAQHLPETLLRIRGEFTAFIDGVQAPTGNVIVLQAGIVQVPEGTGTTVLWSPASDPDAPWIWTDSITLAYEEMVTDVVAIQGMLFGRRVIDSKSMRKLRNTEIQVVFENAGIAGSLSANAVVNGRILAGS